ncbi:MAG: anthranilate phosphoribosyltransferase [Candidatus Omnitrophica bacterium]|nr:anthranilate phosphoribosyltransferase [Candidatus Omnitrophota bacterium]
MIKEAIEKVMFNKDLTRREMEIVIEEIMSGAADTQAIVSFLTALNAKGETIEELTAAVTVMRKFVTKISIPGSQPVLDTCGTGGDKKGTFNISTAVAFVASAGGAIVAKHGNRSVSSRCGSADILEALGVNIHMSVPQIEYCLNTIGIAFLFAPNLHPAMKHVMPARKEIGKRTMFNILGPLTNPAGATHQLLGVYNRDLVPVLAEVMRNLGITHGMVVHGEDGLDEITTTASTYVCEIKDGVLTSRIVRPESYGFVLSSEKDLVGGDAVENAGIIREILNGSGGPRRDIVLFNAGCALYVADKTRSIEEGIEIAAAALDSGMAKEKLDLLIEFSNKKVAGKA